MVVSEIHAAPHIRIFFFFSENAMVTTTKADHCSRAEKRLGYKRRLSQRRKFERRVVNGVCFGMRTLRTQPRGNKVRRYLKVSLSVRSPTLSVDVERSLVLGALGIASFARTPERAWRLVYKWAGENRQSPNTRPKNVRKKRWVPRLSASRTDYLVRFGSQVVTKTARFTAGGLRVIGGFNRVADWTFWSIGVGLKVASGFQLPNSLNPGYEVARAARFYRYHQRRTARWLDRKAALVEVYTRRGLKKRWVDLN